MPDWDTSELSEFGRELNCVVEGLPIMLKELAKRADVRISAIAIGRYMQDGDPEGRRDPGDTGPLYIRRGGIARALTGSQSQGVLQAPDGNFKALPAQGRGKIFTAKVNGAVLEVKKGIDARVVPYARIQEEGGSIVVPITEASRRFFWAMWYKTEDEKWKNMALTNKQEFTITIDGRPYLGPATDDALPWINDQGGRLLLKLFEACFEKTQ